MDLWDEDEVDAAIPALPHQGRAENPPSASPRASTATTVKKRPTASTDQVGDEPDPVDTVAVPPKAAKMEHPKVKVNTPDGTLSLGTFFSGLDTPSIALAHLGVPCNLKFIVEKEADLRTLAKARFGAVKAYKDVTTCDYSTMADVQVLVGGPPCQSFSKAGKLKGMDDSRGKLIYSMVDFIEKKYWDASPEEPVLMIMENASTLLKRFREAYRSIRARLHAIGYSVRAETLNTCKHGLPLDSFPAPTVVTVVAFVLQLHSWAHSHATRARARR